MLAYASRYTYPNELESIKTRCAHIYVKWYIALIHFIHTQTLIHLLTHSFTFTYVHMRHCHEVWKWERARLQSTESIERHLPLRVKRTMAHNVCRAAEIKSRIKFKHEHTMNGALSDITWQPKCSYFFSHFSSLSLSIPLVMCILTLVA